MTEYQITHAPGGHTIHNTQVFSPDNQWVVFDTRNDGGDIGKTCCIAMVNVFTGEVKSLYKTLNQTEYGPGVGAATFSPAENKILFIHGIINSDESRPYGFTRRTGVAVAIDNKKIPIYMDARNISAPFTAGALRGGTHAHTWSQDGKWIAFTYNDYLLEQAESASNRIKDLRVVGVMAPLGPVEVPYDSAGENHRGEKFSVIVTEVTETPEWGSDEIEKAFDEGWIGNSGYEKPDGSWQHKAIAFQGIVRNAEGIAVSEIFVVDIPADVKRPQLGSLLEGTLTTRPMPPLGASQRRITHTVGRPYPGIQGARHWLRTLPDGSQIFFLMKDNNGIVQVHSVSPNGGVINQITYHAFDVQTPFNISPNGEFIAYGADNSVFMTNISSGKSERLTSKSSDAEMPVNGVSWSNDGKVLAYNRYKSAEEGRFLQIFILR